MESARALGRSCKHLTSAEAHVQSLFGGSLGFLVQKIHFPIIKRKQFVLGYVYFWDNDNYIADAIDTKRATKQCQ